MIKKYICSKCFEEFLSIEQVLEHLKNAQDDTHKDIDRENLDAYFDVLEIENLDSREWTDIEQKRIRQEPIKTMPSVPEEYLPSGWIREQAEVYPYKPFYYYQGEYYCQKHKFLTKDLNAFVSHILTEHSKDFENVMKHIIIEQLKNKVTEETSKKTMQELIEKEIQRWLLHAEEKEPEALRNHVEQYFTNLLEYLEGDTTICPYCLTEAIIKNQLHLDKIFYCLQKGAMEEDPRLRKKFEEYKQKYGYYPYMGEERYLCEWNKTPVLLRLHSILHLFQDHRRTFENLVKNNILQGELISFLFDKKYLNKETQAPILKAKENKEKLDLSKLPIKIKKQVNLSKDEEALLRWLDSQRVKKT
jgi:hypothetical protein